MIWGNGIVVEIVYDLYDEIWERDLYEKTMRKLCCHFGGNKRINYELCQRISNSEPHCGHVGGICRHYESVYQALVLYGSELSNFTINVKNEATVGAYGYDYTNIVFLNAVCQRESYQREAQSCSFYIDGQC